MIEKQYVIFVVFIKEKKERRIQGANTFSRSRDPSAKDYEHVSLDLLHFFLAATEKEMKVEKIIKINDGLMKRRELSRKKSCVYS